MQYPTFSLLRNFRFIYSLTGEWPKHLNSNLKKDVETFWKKNTKIYNNERKKNKFYLLSMIPYPSGNLHMGHVRVYVSADALARYHSLLGKKVIYPMGWDSFGLPAENAALQRSIDPEDWTKQNIINMKCQLKVLDCNYEWEREIYSSHPNYYKWTQYIFIKMFECGLAYQKWAEVDWDPVDMTVLAREQVDENGCSWRSGAKVVKKRLKQWFLRTTSFSKALYNELDTLEKNGWKDVADIQREWIGRCDGTYVELPLNIEQGLDQIFPSLTTLNSTLSVFTKTPELLLDNSLPLAIVLKPGHELDMPEIYNKRINLPDNSYYTSLKYRVCNPLNPEITYPLYVTNSEKFDLHIDAKFVLSNQGQNYNEYQPFINHTILPNPMQSEKIMGELRRLNLGGYETSSRLRDWLVSRQRSWGAPIPMLHCPRCQNVQPVPYDNLPVRVQFRRHATCKATLAEGITVQNDTMESPVIPCNKCCHTFTIPDSDTLDTFVDSSWYYLRFLDPDCQNLPFRKDLTDSYMPVDLYVGGKEHAALHLFFARYMQHFLHSHGLSGHKEPFKSLLMMGQVTNKSYRVISTGKYIPKDQVIFKKKFAYEKCTNFPVEVKWEKMSKSKFNGIDPNGLINEHGVDTTRLLVMAEVTPSSSRTWDVQHFKGVLNFQSKLWMTVNELRRQRENPKDYPIESLSKLPIHEENLREKTNNFLSKVNLYFQQNQLSLVISQLEIFCQHLRSYPLSVLCHSCEFEKSLANALIILWTFAPNFASELWAGIRGIAPPIKRDSVFSEKQIDWSCNLWEQSWPVPHLSYPIPCILKIGDNITPFALTNSILQTLTTLEESKVIEIIFSKFKSNDNETDILASLKNWIDHIFLKLKDHNFSINEIMGNGYLSKYVDVQQNGFNNISQLLGYSDQYNDLAQLLILSFINLTIYPNGGLYIRLEPSHSVFKKLTTHPVQNCEYKNGNVKTATLL